MNLTDNFAAIPAITVLAYLFAEIYKSFSPARFYKHIPALCGLVGLVLGIVSFLWIPGYIPAENLLKAAAVGVVSGWAATGVHQIFKQVEK